MEKHRHKPFLGKRAVASVVGFVVLFTQVFSSTAFAKSVEAATMEGVSPGKTSEVYDLVVIVVEEDLQNNNTPFAGLKESYSALKAHTIRDRIKRYSEDIVANNPMTNVQFLYFDRTTDTPATLASALDALYAQGGMVGVVLVGDIPLPVVEDKGRRYVSMFPYTDFEEKVFRFDEERGQFVPGNSAGEARPEIWHGVMRPPAYTMQGISQLAYFFDKNHLYYLGDKNFSGFERKLFFADLMNEQRMMSGELYNYYANYLESWEDLSYNRYHKGWAKQLSGEAIASLPLNSDNPLSASFGAQLKGDAMSLVPDIYTKEIIDQMLPPYYRLYSNYLSQLNTFSENTGRYKSEDVDSVPLLIGMKDEYTRYYLRSVNDALEEKVNEVVEKIQEPLPLLQHSVLKGAFVSGDESTEFLVASTSDSPYVDKATSDEVLYRFHYMNEANNTLYVNGVEADLLESPRQCSLYLGSSKTVKASRAGNLKTMQPIHSAGVHTRLTEGGAVIEDLPAYGISAFSYKNPFAEVLKKGDLITQVNGKNLDYAWSFEQAVEAAYSKTFAEAQKSGQSEQGLVEVSFTREGKASSAKLKFTVNKTGEVSGALFTLYGSGYDYSAGCNAGSTQKDGGRCLPRVAVMPVLDPAGAVAASVEGDIDAEALYSCYSGLPSVRPLEGDSNPYPFVLTPGSKSTAFTWTHDWYGTIMKAYGDFVAQYGETLDPPDSSFAGFARPSAGQIVLNTAGTPVTLKEFSDRYGLFDGIDNDKDGVKDAADPDEAGSAYGIPEQKMDEIGYKLLSKKASYTVPAAVNSFGKDLVLKVSPAPYGKGTFSSVIVHNEPTDYTVSEQVRSQTAKDLPIDHTRYSAFRSKSGALVKVNYPNLFKVKGMAGMHASLASTADTLAQQPGSYRVFGPEAKASEYSLVQIRDEILNSYLLPANSEKEKVADALLWKSLSIDDKHAYILTHSLGGAQQAYVAEAENGYEAAYLVMEEDEKVIDLQFTQDLVEESEAAFSPFSAAAGAGGAGGADVVESAEDGTLKKLSEFVLLSDFLKEMTEFIEYFSELPDLRYACVYDGQAVKQEVVSPVVAQPQGSAIAFDTEGVLIADNTSTMKVRAYTESRPGALETSPKTVKFSVVEQEYPDMVMVGTPNVAATSGIAETVLHAGTKAGRFVLRIEAGSSYPVREIEMFVQPGEPYAVIMDPESNVLPAQGIAEVKVKISAVDQFGNVTKNSFNDVALFAASPLLLDPAADNNPAILGTQFSLNEGRGEVGVRAVGGSGGEPSLVAVLLTPELEEQLLGDADAWKSVDFSQYIGSSRSFLIVDKAELKVGISFDKKTVKVGGEKVQVSAQLLQKGQVVKGYKGPVVVKEVSGLGDFSDDTMQFVTGKKAGRAEFVVEVPGFVSGNGFIEVMPGKSAGIALSSPQEGVLAAQLVDAFGNPATNDSSTMVAFSTTEATKDFVHFDGPVVVKAVQGKAETKITEGALPGTAHLVAKAVGLTAGTLSLQIAHGLPADGLIESAPRALYISLQGDMGSFSADSTASRLMFSGSVQAVSASTDTIDSFGAPSLFTVETNGRVDISDDRLGIKPIPAGESFPYHRFVIEDLFSGETHASVFMVPSPGSSAHLLAEGAAPKGDGFFVEPLSDAFTFEEDKGRVRILKSEKILAVVDEFGTISLSDEDTKLVMPESAGAYPGFEVQVLGQSIARVHFVQKFMTAKGTAQDVFIVPKDSTVSAFFPGVYVTPLTSASRYELVASFSGSSTHEGMGASFIDHNAALMPEMPPPEFGKGFKGQDKHMLLFSAGNPVGVSRQMYAGETDIIYGDPLVRVSDTSFVGSLTKFAQDIGVPLFASDMPIQSVLPMEYTGDGQQDVLLVYESGLVRLLENTKSRKGFHDRGFVLDVFEGIMSAARIDIDGDGFDELLLGTAESCTTGSACMALFHNENGRLVRETFTLNGVSAETKIHDIVSGDLNNDGCSDAVLSDSAGKIRFLYNQKKGGACMGLLQHDGSMKSFSLEGAAIIADIEIGNNFAEYKKDDYPDVLVRPNINPGGASYYLYSDGVDSQGVVNHTLFKKMPQSSGSEEFYKNTFSDMGLPGLDALMKYQKAAEGGSVPALPKELADSLTTLSARHSADKDYNGCVDGWDAFKKKWSEANQEADDFLWGLERDIRLISSGFRCAGAGCLPIPYNKAFLAPDGATPGIAALAFGTLEFPYVMPFYPSSSYSAFRIYTSPTLTMGLGTAFCVGPSVGHTSPCFASAVPVQALGICPDVLGPVNDAISAAKEAVVHPDIGMAAVVLDGTQDFGISDSDLPLSAAGAVNVKIPGFPSVFTDWFDTQTEEIYDALLDLPDFYFIYPDVNSFVADPTLQKTNFGNISTVHDFLRAVNSIPLINIDTREVLVKIPAISHAEIEKYRHQWAAMIKHYEEELEKIKEFWQCDLNEARKTLCDKVSLELTEVIMAARRFMKILDALETLPYKIFSFRHAESQLANQIVCYLDAVMEYSGGYIHRQQKKIESWMKAAEKLVRVFRDWHVVLDLMVDYQVSCDQCKNDRFSKLGLLLSVFVALPELPVVEFPKWPDIVFDMTQIKSGVTIVWPDVKFQPEPIRLPDIPVVTLPEILPDLKVNINVPDFEIPEWLLLFENFTLPTIPALPPLPLPELPDLPRPPLIPEIPDAVIKLAGSLKHIFSILCLLKKGLIPVPEAFLATEIETLTQPSVQAVLPLIASLGIKTPSIQYEYVKEVRITAKTEIGFTTEVLYLLVKAMAQASNMLVEKGAGFVNRATNLPLQQWIDQELNSLVEEAKEEVEEELSFQEPTLKVIPAETLPDEYRLVARQRYLDPSDPLLNRSIAEVKAHSSRRTMPETPELARLEGVRDAFIAYTEGTGVGALTDYDEAMRFIARSDRAVPRLMASSATVPVQQQRSQEASFFGEHMEQRLLTAAENLGPDLVPIFGSDSPEFAASSAAQKGLYLTKDGKSESVIAYTDELSQTKVAFVDADNDKDEDLIYTMGGTVFVKYNRTKDPLLPSGSTASILGDNEVSDFVQHVPRVEDVQVTQQSYSRATLAWAASPRAVRYEVALYTTAGLSGKPAYLFSVNGESASAIVEATLGIENDTYFAVVTAFDADNKASLPSASVAVVPSMCADREPPMPVLSKSDLSISLFEVAEVYAGDSFDPQGEIVSYYLENMKGSPKYLWSDLNVTVDEDGDGLPANDRSNPYFKIGPFTSLGDVGTHEFILHLSDQSGNHSTAALSVSVEKPDITLDETLSYSGVASGGIVPEAEAIPILLMRSRNIYRVVDGVLSLAPQLTQVASSVSDAFGEYFIDDFALSEFYEVRGQDDKVIAEIHGGSGNIALLDPAYSLTVQAATPPQTPTALLLKDSMGDLLMSMYLVADANTDVVLHTNTAFSAEKFTGVHLVDTASGDPNVFVQVSSQDARFPGGMLLFDSLAEAPLAAFDPGGNVLLYAETVSLRVKDNDHTVDPLVIEIVYNGAVIGEMYLGFEKSALTFSAPLTVPFFAPLVPDPEMVARMAEVSGLISQLPPELQGTALTLLQKGVFGDTADMAFFNPQHVLTRSEFVKALLVLLCTLPRDEAYREGGNFTDVLLSNDDLAPFYAFIKEAMLLGIVEGYTGESDTGGNTPFKPFISISRAEAVKALLEVMQIKGEIDMQGVSYGDPWYAPFLDYALNLETPLITPEEAADPHKAMTTEDFLLMASRVLSFYPCALEEGGGSSGAGGAGAGGDVTGGSAAGGSGSGARAGGAPVPGAYLVPGECLACPCIATIAPKSALVPGDVFFTVIPGGKDMNEFVSKSNEVTIFSVTK